MVTSEATAPEQSAGITKDQIDNLVYELTGVHITKIAAGDSRATRVSNARALSMILYRAVLGWQLKAIARAHGCDAHTATCHAAVKAADGLMHPDTCTRAAALLADLIRKAANHLGFTEEELLQTFGNRKTVASVRTYSAIDPRYNKPLSNGKVFDRYFRAYIEQKIAEGVPLERALSVHATLEEWQEYLEKHRPYRRYLASRFPSTFEPDAPEPLQVRRECKPIDVAKIVAAEMGVTADKILAKQRGNLRVSWARHMVAAILRGQTLMTLTEIGKALQRDHTTVLHSTQKVGAWQDNQPNLFAIYQRCFKAVQEQSEAEQVAA